jgi:predicted Ser/Thr protein kinase
VDSGTLITGRYRLERLIASGGMGSVWRARDERLEREVAVKVLHPGIDGSQRPKDRFEREAKILASLKGPGWVDVYDFGEETDGDREALYLVMELVEGVSLAELLHREERLDPARTMRIVAEAAETLATAHRRGIVHRDVKPGNILIDADDRVRVVDFGISLFADRSRLTPTDAVLGTAPYVSPEQLRDKGVTGASDLYSLGAVAYECLTGAPPFDAEDPAAIIHGHLYSEPPELPGHVPAAIAGVVTRTLRKAPEERWPSGEDLAAACRAATTGEHPVAGAAIAAVRGAAAEKEAAAQGTAAQGAAGQGAIDRNGAGTAGPTAADEAEQGSRGETGEVGAGTRVGSGVGTGIGAEAGSGAEIGAAGAGNRIGAEAGISGEAGTAGAGAGNGAEVGAGSGFADGERTVPLESGPVGPPFRAPVGPPATPPTAAGTPDEGSRKRRRLTVLAVAVVAVVAILGIVIWSPWNGASPVTAGEGDAATSAAEASEGAASGEPSPSGSPTGGESAAESTASPEETGSEEDGTEASGGNGDADGAEAEPGGETDTEDQPKEGSGAVPSVLGLTTFEAREELQEEGFGNAVAEVGIWWATPEPAHCTVMQQSPAPGETADYGDTINLSYHSRNAEGTTCEW